jgi:hypothetical protein
MGWGLRLTRVFGGFAILIGIGLVGSFLVTGPIRGSDAARQKLEQRFDEFDANGDGRLTAGELPQRRLFEALDLDRDGVVTKPEAQRAVAAGGLKALQNRPQAGAAATAAATASAWPPVRQGPRPLVPGDHGVGSLVPITTYVGLDGRSHSVADGGAAYTVFAMTSTSCPLSRKYLPTCQKFGWHDDPPLLSGKFLTNPGREKRRRGRLDAESAGADRFHEDFVAGQR